MDSIVANRTSVGTALFYIPSSRDTHTYLSIDLSIHPNVY